MDQAQNLRPFPSWFLSRPGDNAEVATTRLPLDEEYWLALRHPAEVESAGLGLLATRNLAFGALHQDQKDQLWKEFRSYIRQAEGFYRGACVLPWKSSPLNYYYAFMNLSKALAVVRGLLLPQAAQVPRVLHHGMSARVDIGPPEVWRLRVQSADGGFSLLYQSTIGNPIAHGTEFDVRLLLGYATPIGWQIQKSGVAIPRAWFPCKWIIAVAPANGCWDIIGMFRDLDLTRLPAAFDAAYEEIPQDAIKTFAFRNLGLQASEAGGYRFVQRKAPLPIAAGQVQFPDLRLALRNDLAGCIFEFLDDPNYHFAIGLPYVAAGQNVSMDEGVALYAVTYFLSSLVRYHPDYMDQIGDSNEAWLIESFAKAAPLFLLRYLASAILGYPLMLESA